MEIINRVKNSGLVTIDLVDFVPTENEIVEIDIKDQLWNGIALREKEFRDYIENHDWSTYTDKIVHVYCSEDAIIPPWAYMLLASALHNYAQDVFYGTRVEFLDQFVLKRIFQLNPADYIDARVVIKGCAKISNIERAFTALTQKLRPVAKSIMYGEPCSTVPIYKAPKK